MSFANPRVGRCCTAVLAFGIVAFLIVASGALPSAVVHADTIGPNLGVSVTFSASGHGGGTFHPALPRRSFRAPPPLPLGGPPPPRRGYPNPPRGSILLATPSVPRA